MHQRHLDKIEADKRRLQEEENKRIAVSENRNLKKLWLIV
jgi:hypothetical protein